MQQERSFLRRVCVLKPFIYENCPSSRRAYFSIRLAVKTSRPHLFTIQLAIIIPKLSWQRYAFLPTFSVQNQKDILLNLGILLDGKYRENLLDAGIYNYLEKYTSSRGSAPDGLYCYNFCLNTEPSDFQPSGAINASKFSTIELEFTTFYPPLDPSANFLTICDPETQVPVGVNKPTWRIYDYNYNLTVFEERFNMLTFLGGNCGLMYAR